MGYNKEQQLKAQNNKFRKEISLKIIGELRELTGEAFDDLEQLLKREIPEEIQNNQFEIHSKTTLYRSLGANADNELNTNRLKRLADLEGELRVRLIEIPIEYEKENKSLRILCFYETRNKYFCYKKLDRNGVITIKFLMLIIDAIQTEQLKIPISSILLTQKLLHNFDETFFYWSIEQKSKTDCKEALNFANQSIIRIEQKPFPVQISQFAIDGKNEKTHILTVLNDVTRHHQSFAKKRLRQHQRLFILHFDSSRDNSSSLLSGITGISGWGSGIGNIIKSTVFNLNNSYFYGVPIEVIEQLEVELYDTDEEN